MSEIPNKLYYKIGEICEICGIQPHVLRYWESEFTTLSPTKNKSGQRIYRPKDLELVRTIKHLLYDQGFTIAGANKKLQESGREGVRESVADDGRAAELTAIRKELEEVVRLLQG